MTQAEALKILKTGANVFLTGEPGSGKTHTVNEYVRFLKSHGVEPSVTASTGIAATHIGGTTIHSWAGIGIKRSLDKYALDRIAANERVARRVGKATVLIIDEVSMLGPETLGMVDAVCREVRRSHEAFGGLSVLLVGDFFQLPPVVRYEEDVDAKVGLFENKREQFAYQSSAWKRANFLTCYLTEQYRQDDAIFLDLLNAIRRNEFNSEHMKHITNRKVLNSDGLEQVPQLYSHNMDVDRINIAKLGQIQSDEKSFQMSTEGPEHLVGVLMRGCLSPERLVLKVGASVMCTKNNIAERFVNGTIGKVIAFDKTTSWPVVKTRNGRSITIKPMEWTIEENGKIKARISQLPLRLSWAITIHKSQGQSLDAALMDLSSTFEYGQGYVALSRVRRLEGLYLLGWNDRAFSVHPEVLARDGEFRRISEEACTAFTKFNPGEIIGMHSNFIRAIGGKKEKKGNCNMAEMRTMHPMAYQSWNVEEDGRLIQLHKSGVAVKEIAEKLGRKFGSIHSRLHKHGLL